MKKFFSCIRNFKLFKRQNLKKTFLSFSKKEWILFSLFFILFITSTLYVLNTVNQNISVKVARNGGTITEGIIGTPRFINPILAFSDVDKDLTTLIYSGLLRKDREGQFIPDIAEKYEVSEDGLSYLFTIKDEVYFHDGKEITADDIIFTTEETKNTLVKNLNGSSFEGIKIEKIDEKNVKFSMDRPDSSFLEKTTFGIMPKHLWEGFPMELSPLNTDPIGSGPFRIKKIKKDSEEIVKSYELESFKDFALGKPYINKFIIKFYPNEEELITALKSGEVEQISQISSENAKNLEEKYRIESYILPRVFGLFFNQNENQIFIDKNVISAINLILDKKQIVEEVLFGYGTDINSPIPKNMKGEKISNDKNLSYEEKVKKALELLEKSRWEKNEDGFLEKNDILNKKTITTPLSFSISTSNSSELKKIAQIIKEDLELIGIKVEVKTFELGDLNQSVIRPRNFDSLLFGEIINHESDLFAFWHSSQRKDPGLNIASYTNVKVDKILEEAITTLQKEKREEKYTQFEEEIQKSMPAVFIYSPSLIYIVKNDLKGLSEKNIISPKDRFLDSYLWYLNVENVWKIFVKN
ncbi:MAG: ABC transporter substrate-binding protein [Candidatus Paceibacterota bacterium]